MRLLPTALGCGLVAGALVSGAGASAAVNIFDYGDTHASIGQSPPHPGPQGDHPHLRPETIYTATTFPVRLRLRPPDQRWGGAQFQSKQFRFVQFFHNHRDGDPPLNAVGEITLEASTAATPSLASTLRHLRATPHIVAGPTTPTRIAGFSGKQLDATIVGSDNPASCRTHGCPEGISIVPFTTNHHCGYCKDMMHAETLDAKYAAKGQLFRLIVLDVRGKTVVVYLESLYADQPKFPPAKLFPKFLPYAQRMLKSLSFPR